jgi:copper chaperone CopZ
VPTLAAGDALAECLRSLESQTLADFERGAREPFPHNLSALREALEVELRLEQVAGVEEVSANPTTGNVLILYNPRILKQEEIISFLMELGYLSLPVGGSGITDSPLSMERTAATVAVTLMEMAFSRLVGALI